MHSSHTASFHIASDQTTMGRRVVDRTRRLFGQIWEVVMAMQNLEGLCEHWGWELQDPHLIT